MRPSAESRAGAGQSGCSGLRPGLWMPAPRGPSSQVRSSALSLVWKRFWGGQWQGWLLETFVFLTGAPKPWGPLLLPDGGISVSPSASAAPWDPRPGRFSLGASPLRQAARCYRKVLEDDVCSCSATRLQVCLGRKIQVRVQRRAFISSGSLCVTCGVFYGQSRSHTSRGRRLGKQCARS